MGVEKTPMTLLKIYTDSFELEKGFLRARVEIESGAYSFGNSDDEQAMEVSVEGELLHCL